MSLSILGTGSALPAHVKTNDDLCAFFETSDEWIRTRTGIQRRHLMTDETVTDLAVAAAQNALQAAGVAPQELDYILCPTLGGDFITPSLACMVQKEIGAGCPALDLNAACSGFLYTLDVAAALLARDSVRNILVVAAEGLSRVTDWTDRSTAVLFGDGAGAVVLAPGDDLLHLQLTAQGCHEPLHACFPAGNLPGHADTDAPYIRMDGNEVYKFAVNAIFTGLERALEETGLSPQDVDHVLLHQANLRIIDAARKRLSIPEERYAINIDEVGNLSAASIPVLLDSLVRTGRVRPGDTLLLSAFGGGFTTGTALLRWPQNPAG